MVTMGNSVGDRIRELRNGRLTQQALATAAGVSVDLVRKLEQGQRHTASIANLHRIARALDRDLADLFGRQAFPTADEDAGVVALRQAVADVDDLLGTTDGSPVSLREAGRTVTYLWGAYWGGKYDLLTGLIPPALSSLRATLHNASISGVAKASNALALTYGVSGCTLAHLRQTDSAFIAIRRAVEIADKANDELLAATLRGSVAWQLLVAGRFDEAERIAVRTAEGIEPTGNVPLPHLSVYGSLILTAATAAARGQKVAQARDLLASSREVADRIGADRDDYQTAFGPSQVTMQAVDIGVVTEDYGSALQDAKAMPQNPGLPLAARARNLADRAFAHVRMGHDDKALNLLLTIEGMAPDWIKHQTSAKQVTRELLAREQRKSTRLRDLAVRIGTAHNKH